MVQIETLPNGVRIVTEPMDTVRSAALGIWVGGGSREEGFSHGIHHPKVRFQEDSLSYGAAAYVIAAKALLSP